MKANEAPENMYIPPKIYLPYKDRKVIGLVKETGVPFKSGVDGNIEYTRTDAFIEKACKFIRGGGTRGDAYIVTEFGEEVFDFVQFAEDFKNYMKGG